MLRIQMFVSTDCAVPFKNKGFNAKLEPSLRSLWVIPYNRWLCWKRVYFVTQV
jgi:hypothetical protein